MSYILDALKKSEKERQRGTLPDMLTVQDIVAEKPRKSLVWVYLLGVVLSLNAGMMVWWVGVHAYREGKGRSTGNSSKPGCFPDKPYGTRNYCKGSIIP